jgi:6,7-dimethyl-8-ribityllumazine synthase
MRTTDQQPAGGSDDGASPRIAFVQSEWHADLVDRCRDAFLEEVAALGIDPARVDLFRVPGAFEIPLHAKRLAGSGAYAAVVGAGLVVDGGIYRHEFVAEAVVSGLMRVQLDTDVPVLSVVLTPHHFHEHADHASFFAGHLATKGVEAAQACARTLDSLALLSARAA